MADASTLEGRDPGAAPAEDLRVHAVLRFLFYACFVRPLVLLVLGLHVRGRAGLPRRGPALVVANHNSHLDVLVLLTLLGRKALPQVRVVAAADYFLKNRLLAWFARRIIGIIPLERGGPARRDSLDPIVHALEAGHLVILFPEGTRGAPEQRAPLARGVAHVARRCPAVPVVPVWLDGCGKALPRGEALLVPFFCDVEVGASITSPPGPGAPALRAWHADLEAEFARLEARCVRSCDAADGAW